MACVRARFGRYCGVRLCVALIAACGRIGFDPPSGPGTGDGGPGDGRGRATDGGTGSTDALATATSCLSPGDPESFDSNGPGCDTWGAQFAMSATVGEAGSALLLMLGPGTATAGCIGPALPFANG